MQKLRHLIGLVAVAVLLVAPAAADEAPLRGGLTLDEEFEILNREFAGFGGMFYDESGKLTVFLKDPADRERFVKATGVDVRVRRGRYDFAELNKWRRGARPLLGTPGVVTLDVDETSNRVRVGVEPSMDRKALRQLKRTLRDAGIPRRAVDFERREAMIPLSHNLTHSFNPVPAGVQINYPGFLCTLGFNVKIGNRCFFVTNDHCTEVQGANTGTPYGQPLLSGGTIATEVFDPPFIVGGSCPANSRCRWSDAAAARYADPNMCEFGSIARTTGINSLTIDAAQPRWEIVSKQQSPLVNQLMAKVGRTTGWTEGRVTDTCVDTSVFGENIVRFCQAFVAAGVDSGDSGSPVFRRRLSTSVAQLTGILWGGNGAGTEFVYSPMENIEIDFGRSLPVF